jgi:hypothetical protein
MMIEESPIERDVNMDTGVEAVMNGVAGDALGETTRTIPTAASEPQEYNENGKRRRSVIPEAQNTPGDWRSRMERTIWQQAREVTQLYQIVENLAKTLHQQNVLLLLFNHTVLTLIRV